MELCKDSVTDEERFQGCIWREILTNNIQAEENKS
jgi:hypothetical protein